MKDINCFIVWLCTIVCAIVIGLPAYITGYYLIMGLALLYVMITTVSYILIVDYDYYE